MVNKKALKSRMEEKEITFEDLRKALNVPLWKAKRFIAGTLDMDILQAEVVQNTLEIEDKDFGYYFFA